MQLNIPPDVKPIFATDVSVNIGMKVNVAKDKKGKDEIKKWALVELLFIDKNTRNIIGRMLIDPFTAMNLSKMLSESTNKLFKEMKSKKIPANMKKQVESARKAKKESKVEYIG